MRLTVRVTVDSTSTAKITAAKVVTNNSAFKVDQSSNLHKIIIIIIITRTTLPLDEVDQFRSFVILVHRFLICTIRAPKYSIPLLLSQIEINAT